MQFPYTAILEVHDKGQVPEPLAVPIKGSKGHHSITTSPEGRTNFRDLQSLLSENQREP